MAKTSSDKISDAASVDHSISNLGYEDAMKQLESIVDQLESGAISLEGKMIDKPVILQAEKFLHQAGLLSD